MRKTTTISTEEVYELTQEDVEDLIRREYRNYGPSVVIDLDGTGQRIMCIVRIQNVETKEG